VAGADLVQNERYIQSRFTGIPYWFSKRCYDLTQNNGESSGGAAVAALYGCTEVAAPPQEVTLAGADSPAVLAAAKSSFVAIARTRPFRGLYFAKWQLCAKFRSDIMLTG
jgi:hypothetical protein